MKFNKNLKIHLSVKTIRAQDFDLNEYFVLDSIHSFVVYFISSCFSWTRFSWPFIFLPLIFIFVFIFILVLHENVDCDVWLYMWTLRTWYCRAFFLTLTVFLQTWITNSSTVRANALKDVSWCRRLWVTSQRRLYCLLNRGTAEGCLTKCLRRW